jgi:peptide/nickel transport system substrate-binding protein
MKFKTRSIAISLVVVTLLLSACNTPLLDSVPTNTQTITGSTTESAMTPAINATEEIDTVLTICTSALPESLFPFDGDHTQIKENILSLLLQPGFDVEDGALQPLSLAKIPTTEDGDIRLEPVPVQRGQTIIDASGALMVLKAGVTVRPSGCRSADCVITWDGDQELILDQMVIEFQLQDGLMWSDGTPVTAADSVFSYKIASSLDAPGLKWTEDRTADYSTLDPLNVKWVGRPGFSTHQLEAFFWTPLPWHLFDGSESWTDLSVDEPLSTAMLSYGPYVLMSWQGTEMRLRRNPDFQALDNTFSMFDLLIFREIERDVEGAFEAVQNGQCDVLDSSFGLESSPLILSQLESDPALVMHVQPDESWTQLVFGIQPSSYDEYYNPIYGDRPDFFGDLKMRYVIASCLDRETMLKETSNNMGEVWQTFLSPTLSQISMEDQIQYDPTVSVQWLEEMGWIDHDNDPQTPRQAWGVSNVPDGTNLGLSLLINPSGFQQSLGNIIKTSLNGCGIEVNVITLTNEELYLPGPTGLLFGRNFDLALIAWHKMPDLDCKFFMGSQIPENSNKWIGTNLTGYLNEAYDSACSTAALALPEAYLEAVRLAELEFMGSLPAVPLLSQPHLMVTSTLLLPADVVFTSEADFYRYLVTGGISLP